jgi:predicted ATPase/DNA-binding SARP family transcriptional activator
MEFRVLGPIEVVGDGAAIALGGPKQRALLAELLLSRGAAVPRERLVDALWGDRPPASAQSSLQVYVHGLRRAVGADRVETRGGSYRVRVEPDELDLVRFERLLAHGRRALTEGAPAEADEVLDAALGLWRGEALADLGDSPVRAAAPGLEELRRQALELRIDARLALGEHDEVIAVLEELVETEPYRERLREQLITALYRAGRQRDALAAYQGARRTLADDLGIEPGPALRELERAILRQDEGLAIPRPSGGRPTLPAPTTPLIGRRLDVAALEAMVRGDGARLVTLTGPGGTGKTRLALAAAEQIAAGSRDGAAFVDLSSIQDAELLPVAVASALGLEDPRDLESRLRDSSVLLVLDNLEQMAEPAAPLVAVLLERAPRLRIFATSRVPLRVRIEREYPVQPLPVPDPARTFEELAGNEAIALFAARACAVDPAFALTPVNAPTVGRICVRLDGLPLAIELAAARVRTLPLGQLERRLEGALDLLVGGARDLPPRQRTLRSTLDWSFELLDQDARELLPRLAVFSGGFTLESLETLGGEEAVPALDALIQASLVRRHEGRFGLLETIREYGLSRLEPDEEAALRVEHAAHFLEVAESAWEGILAGGEPEAEGMGTLDAETENLRAAFEHARWVGDDETLVRLALAQRWFWLVRGRFAEAGAAFTAAVVADVEPLLHGAALNGAATFAVHQGDAATAKEQWEEALEIFRLHGDDREAARCFAELGGVAVAEGDLASAREMYEEAAGLFHELGQPIREGIALSNVASIAGDLGELESAVAFGERAIKIQRGLRDLPDLAVSLANLAPTELRRGNVEQARSLLREAVEIAEEYGFQLLLAHAVAIAAELAAEREPELAARLVGAAETAFAGIGGAVPEGVRLAFARISDRIGDGFEAQLAGGRALLADQALDEARHLFEL